MSKLISNRKWTYQSVINTAQDETSFLHKEMRKHTKATNPNSRKIWKHSNKKEWKP